MSQAYSLQQENGKLVYRDSVEGVEAVIPATLPCAGLITMAETAVDDHDAVLGKAMAAPIGSPRLRDIAKGKRRVAILVSDATRAVATARALPFVVEELMAAGLGLDAITLVVAIGVHRDATAEEMLAMAGPYAGRVKVMNHDPYTEASLVKLGVTVRGTMVEVNRFVYESDLRIGIGKVEPHEFAGYSGGRKSVLPGIASEGTILHNHRPEMILHPDAAPGVLAGNPVHEDMLEAGLILGLDFFVNIVQDAAGRPIGAFAGDMVKSHDAATAYAAENWGATVPAKANIHLGTPGVPLNIDFYQSIKPLIALYPALKKGDVAVLYTACPEGVNSPDMLKPFEAADNIDGITDFLNANYRIQMDHSLLLCKLYRKGVRVVTCSPGVPAAELELMLMRPAASVEDGLAIAEKMVRDGGAAPLLSVFPMPQKTVVSA